MFHDHGRQLGPDADDRWIEYDIAFHRGLVEASGLTPLLSVCDLLRAFFDRFRTAMGDFQKGKEDHRRIVEVLRSEKLDTAVELLRHHLSWYESHENASASP